MLAGNVAMRLFEKDNGGEIPDATYLVPAEGAGVDVFGAGDEPGALFRAIVDRVSPSASRVLSDPAPQLHPFEVVGVIPTVLNDVLSVNESTLLTANFNSVFDELVAHRRAVVSLISDRINRCDQLEE